MADPEFVLDAVIGFLTSPIWNSPVPTFIEQNCLGKGNYPQTLGMTMLQRNRVMAFEGVREKWHQFPAYILQLSKYGYL